jgi:hypothetical protein
LKNKIKRKQGDWHHRLPDFQLVYCGPKKERPNKKRIIPVLQKNVENHKKKEQIENVLQ